jgi:hypothetical protein
LSRRSLWRKNCTRNSNGFHLKRFARNAHIAIGRLPSSLTISRTI